jgi:inorganic pyrophosphatase
VIETPAGSANKYEIDPGTGAVWLNRRFAPGLRMPVDYGFIPGTAAPDGDPLDAVVIGGDPAVPGCHVKVRILGLLRLNDRGREDSKIVTVLADDPEFEQTLSVDGLPVGVRGTIERFFASYKPGVAYTCGWGSIDEAMTLLARAMRAAT